MLDKLMKGRLFLATNKYIVIQLGINLLFYFFKYIVLNMKNINIPNIIFIWFIVINSGNINNIIS